MATTEEIEDSPLSPENPEVSELSSEEAIEFFLRLEPNKSAREIFRELNAEDFLGYGYANFMNKIVQPLEDETDLITSKGKRRGKKYFYGEGAFPVLKELSGEGFNSDQENVPDLGYCELDSEEKAVAYMVDKEYSFGEMSAKLGFEVAHETVEDMRDKDIIAEEEGSYTDFYLSANVSEIPGFLDFEEEKEEEEVVESFERTETSDSSSLYGRSLSEAILGYNDPNRSNKAKSLMHMMAQELQDKDTSTYREMAAETGMNVDRISLIAEDLWDAGIADIGETAEGHLVRLRDEFRSETYFRDYSNLE